MQSFDQIQSLRSFGLQVQQSLNRRDPAFFNEHFDFAGSSDLMHAVLGRQSLLGSERRRYRNLYRPGWCDYGQMLVNRLEAGSSFRFVSWLPLGGQYRLVFRLLDEHMNVNYFELLVRAEENGWLIRDVLDYQEGEHFSELHPMLLELEFSPGGFRQRWARRLGLAGSDYRRYREFMSRQEEGDFVQAMAVWESFPQQMRNRKYFQLQRIRVCAHLRSERFLDAVEGYCNCFRPDGSFCLSALEGYRLNEMYEATLDMVNHLDRCVGGDAALNYHRGRLNAWMGRREEAVSYGQLFACMEPSFEAGYELLEHVLPAPGLAQAMA